MMKTSVATTRVLTAKYIYVSRRRFTGLVSFIGFTQRGAEWTDSYGVKPSF